MVDEIPNRLVGRYDTQLDGLTLARLVINEGRLIDSYQLGVFLIEFDRLYRAIYRIGSKLALPRLDTLVAPVSEENRLIGHSAMLSLPFSEDVDRDVDLLWSIIADRASRLDAEGRKDGIKIKAISRNSPLEITAYVVPFALIVAVIFSGGRVELPGFKCELHPLGEGIKAIRNALAKTPKKQRQLHPPSLHGGIRLPRQTHETRVLPTS